MLGSYGLGYGRISAVGSALGWRVYQLGYAVLGLLSQNGDCLCKIACHCRECRQKHPLAAPQKVKGKYDPSMVL